MGVQVSESLLAVLLGIDLMTELLGRMVIVQGIANLSIGTQLAEEAPNCPPVAAPFSAVPVVHRVPISSRLCQHLLFSVFFL